MTTQQAYDAVIIGMHRQGASVWEISASTLESAEYVCKVLEDYFNSIVP